MRNQTRIGISSLIFNLDKALKICEDNKILIDGEKKVMVEPPKRDELFNIQ